MKTKETSTKQIYITVVTSGLTMLANKVARVLQPNEDIFDACSELANDIAKENGLERSNVLLNYYNHYSDETPQFDNWRIPSKPKSTKEQAGEWFSNKSYLEQHSLSDKYFESRNPSLLTIEQVEEIWRKEILNQEIQNSIDVESWSNGGSNL